MNAIAILTMTPSHDLLEFYSKFARLGYQVFVVIDDNNFNLDSSEVKIKNAGVSLIQFDDYECRRAGYFDLNPVIKKRSGCSAWEKALYYFCCQDLSHDNVWFIEDDVFVPNHETILNVDRKYEKADIISAANVVNECGTLDGWFWWQFVPKTIVRVPWAKSLVCAVRLSRRVRAAFDSFIRLNKNKLRFQNAVMRLVGGCTAWDVVMQGGELGWRKSLLRKYFFIEFVFHTLAHHNQLSVVKAQELSGVIHRKEWDVSEMNSGTIYHPLKDHKLHNRYRKVLNQTKRPSH